jgi:hypothetical protein
VSDEYAMKSENENTCDCLNIYYLQSQQKKRIDDDDVDFDGKIFHEKR